MKKLKCNVGEYAVIFNQKKQFLILKLTVNKKYSREAWMLPGGRLHVDDKSEKGLQREIREETGLKVKVLTPVHTARFGSEKPSKYVVFYLCQLLNDGKVKLNSEHKEFQWVTFSQINKINFHNYNSKIAIQKSNKILSIIY